jgi:N-acetyl-gamma-glutamyl-phosphate reductase
MKPDRIKTAVIGASGYTGQELLRLLAMHPAVELVAVTSRQEAGRSLVSVFPRLAGAPSVAGLDFMEPDIDAIAATGATVAHGLLHIELAREVPEALKPRRIEIAQTTPKAALLDASAA